MHGKIGKIENQRQGGDKNEALQEAIFRGLLGKITNARDEAKAQRQYQNDKSDQDGKKIKRVAGAGIGHCFFVTIVRKCAAIHIVRSGIVRRVGGRLDLLTRKLAKKDASEKEE